MFLDHLSVSVLQLCGVRKLSYESAAEQCHLSSRYFGDIVRGKTSPTIRTLEKLCTGFELTPNDLLIPSSARQEPDFREPMTVTPVYYVRYPYGRIAFPVCPRCGNIIEREYQAYCDRCGQRLNWKDFSEAKKEE